MRILVVTSGALFVRGGHMIIAEETVAALRRAGHQAEVLVTPQNRFGRQLSAYLATWLTDVGLTADGHVVDRVISFRFPSYAVRHPAHVCWLNHRMREYYDLWGDLQQTLRLRDRAKESIRRRLIHSLDRYLLRHNVTRLLAQSRTVQARLARFGGLASEVLYPPPPERAYRTDGYGDYVFAVSRLERLKRLDLLVEAAALTAPGGLRFKIAGVGPEEERLRARIDALGLRDRVELLGGIADDALLDHLARCRAVFFAPFQEDYGFVTLQAFRSAKAVVTTRDSGGPAELVRDGENGFVTEPEPGAVARQIEALGRDGGLAERLGRQARRDADAYTWERTVDALLGIQNDDRSVWGRPAVR